MSRDTWTFKECRLTKSRYLHRFRKTFATKMHHAGMPLRDLQVILGHKSLTTTEKYLAESDLKATHMRALADKAFSF